MFLVPVVPYQNSCYEMVNAFHSFFLNIIIIRAVLQTLRIIFDKDYQLD